MSILIKGIEMPKECNKCPIKNINSHDVWYETCPVTKFSPRQVPYNGKPDWCPLIEVSIPHGGLIDANELKRQVHEMDWSVKYYPNKFMDMVLHAPIVVEAEV